MFGCIKRNIIYFVNKQKALLVLIIASQLVSIMTILFSYGIINHYNVKNEAVEGKLLEFDIEFNTETKDASIDIFNKEYEKILEIVKKKLDFIYVNASCEGHLIGCHSGYQNGKFTLCYPHKNLESNIVSGGRVFTEEELNNGDKVAIIQGKFDGENYLLDGERYEIIGRHKFYLDDEDINFLMPIKSLPRKGYMVFIAIRLNIPLNEKEHNELSELILTKLDSTAIIPEFEGVNDIENTKTNNTLIVAGILLIVFSAVNYCIMYRYILEKRKKTFAIYRICGCSRGKGVLMYIIELLGMSMILFGIMVPVYHYVILPKLKGMFEYITEFYCIEKYLMIGVFYFVSLLIAYMILIIGIVRKTPLMLSKEGEI